MQREFYTISVYVDENENLIGIPCGDSKKYGIADINTILKLDAPYTANDVEEYIEKVINACYTKKHDDSSDISTIEKYTKKKGFVNATRDFFLISIVKTEAGYSLMATMHDYEKGPLPIDDDERIVELDYTPGKLYDVIYEFINVYMKADMFYKEKQLLAQQEAEGKN